MGIRVYPSGKKSFILRYRGEGGRNGTQRYLTLGTFGEITLEEANKLAKDNIHQLYMGNDPTLKREMAKEKLSYEDLFRLFKGEHLLVHCKKTTSDEYERSIKLYFLSKYGNRKFDEVSPHAFASLHISMKKTPYAANRLLSYLKSLLSFGRKRGLLPKDFNPLDNINKFKEEARNNALTEAELALLGNALNEANHAGILKENGSRTPLNPYIATALWLYLLTGCRKNEILTMKWENMDLEKKILHLPDAKGGKADISLSDEAVEIIRNTPRIENNPYVIVGGKEGQHIVSLKRTWNAILLMAGIGHKRIHDLRDTFGTHAAMQGLNAFQIQALMRHKDIKTTQGYINIAEDMNRTNMQGMGCYLSKMMKGEDKNLPTPPSNSNILTFKKKA